MKSNYQDRYTRWHDKECKNGDPSSNNGWIYTAYAKYLAPDTTNSHYILLCAQGCIKSYSPLIAHRLPGKPFPPMSKDEIIGLVSLGLMHNHELQNSHYNFCNIDRNFDRKLSFKSVYKAIKTLWGIRKEHRNYVWQNQLVDAYPLAFKLGPEDIYYVKKMSGEKPSLLETGIAYLNGIMTYYKGNKSARMMLWLKMEDLKHPLLKYIPKKQWVLDYFGEKHPFYIGLK